MNRKPDHSDETLGDEANERIVNSPIDLDRPNLDKRKSTSSSKTAVDSRPGTNQTPRRIDDPSLNAAIEGHPDPEQFENEFFLPSRIGRFEVLERLGIGGHGIVFRAIDRGVGREVAIKIPRVDLLSSRQQLLRFAREANIVGLLEHPNIVPIYECDWHGSVPYIVMPCIRGKTLGEWRASQPNVAPRTAAEIVRQLVTAVQHAHERGVLHRDLKPGNVLLAAGEKGDALGFIPKLTDFGSAKREGFDTAMTRTGVMIGTTAYMSPEQIDGRNRDITAQTDVYGLGVILYELLTGQLPFRSDSVSETLQMISENQPASFESCRVDIPLNLKIICLKCLDKTPSNRYRSASALADDLQKFLNGDPISARPTSTVVRFTKWCRRHPLTTAMTTLVVFGVLTLTSISLVYNARLVEQLERTESAQRLSRQHELRAIQSEEKSRKRAYVSDMRNAKLSWDEGDVRQTFKLLNRYEPQEGISDIRDFAWWYLWREYHESSRVLGTHEKEAMAVAVAPSGSLAASGGTDSIIRLWSLSSGQLIAELRGHGPGPIHSLSFSPTGERLVSGGEDGTLRIWDVAAGKELTARREHQSAVVCVLYAPQGNLIASGGMDGTVHLWDSQTAEPVRVLSGHTRKTRCLAFHPSDPLLVSASLDGTIRFWNLDDGANARFGECATCELYSVESGWYPRAIAIDPNGDSLIAATTRRELVQISLLKENLGETIKRTNEKHQPHTLAWLPENELLIGLGNAQIRLADVRSPEHTLLSLKGHADAVFSIAATPDASCLVSASRDGAVRYWPKFRDRNRFRISPAETGAEPKASKFAATIQWCGRYLAVDDVSHDQVLIFRMPERTFERAISHATGAAAVLSPSGEYLVLAEPNGIAKSIRVVDGAVAWTNRFTDQPWRARSYRPIAIDQMEQWIGLIHEKQLVVMSLPTLKVEHRLEHPSEMENIVFRHRTNAAPQIISTDIKRDLRIWDIPAGRLLETHSIGSNATTSLAISSDQRLIACMSTDYRIRIRKLDGMAEVASISGQDDKAVHISFLFGGSKVLAYRNHGVTLWDVEEEAELIRFPEFLNAQGRFASNPDGNQLAVYQDGMIHLLDGRSASEVEQQIHLLKDLATSTPSVQ